MKLFLSITVTVFLMACNGNTDKPYDDEIVPKPTPLINYTILAQYPHDTSAYTQGLQIYNGKFYEGTGDFESSSIRITDIKSGKVEKKHMMGTSSIFGEGINVFKGKIYQLTWRSHLVYVYNIDNIENPISTFNWPYEGWGITNNGSDLIISDGTANLYFVNPDNFKVKTIVGVKENGSPVHELNELEYIDGYIFANIYHKEFIVKIRWSPRPSPRWRGWPVARGRGPGWRGCAKFRAWLRWFAQKCFSSPRRAKAGRGRRCARHGGRPARAARWRRSRGAGRGPGPARGASRRGRIRRVRSGRCLLSPGPARRSRRHRGKSSRRRPRAVSSR